MEKERDLIESLPKVEVLTDKELMKIIAGASIPTVKLNLRSGRFIDNDDDVVLPHK